MTIPHLFSRYNKVFWVGEVIKGSPSGITWRNANNPVLLLLDANGFHFTSSLRTTISLRDGVLKLPILQPGQGEGIVHVMDRGGGGGVNETSAKHPSSQSS